MLGRTCFQKAGAGCAGSVISWSGLWGFEGFVGVDYADLGMNNHGAECFVSVSRRDGDALGPV